MEKFVEKLSQKVTASDSLTLPFLERIKSRQRVVLDSGLEAGLMLPRGTVLRHGDRLSSERGMVIEVHAAVEGVSTVTATNAYLLARVCYHLGNRHVPLQIEPQRLRYQHDHVLDEMVRGLGASIRVEQATFEPEAGAYGSHGKSGHQH